MQNLELPPAASSSKSAPTSPTTKRAGSSSKSGGHGSATESSSESASDLSFTGGSKLAGRFAEWDKAKQNAARLEASGVSQGGLSESQQDLLDDLSAAPSMAGTKPGDGKKGFRHDSDMPTGIGLPASTGIKASQ